VHLNPGDTDDTRSEDDFLSLFETKEIPLDSFYLGTPQGRVDFLWRLSELGEEGLWAATAHVWDSLASPKAYRTAAMAQAANVEGSGKVGLMSFLAKFLTDFEAETNPPPLPEPTDYISAELWQQAVQRHFQVGEEAMLLVIDRYSTIMNGDEARPMPSQGKVLKGRWRKRRPDR
jgi:hypothetical protein